VHESDEPKVLVDLPHPTLLLSGEDLTELTFPPLKQMRPPLAGTRKADLSQVATVSLFITDDLAMRKITRRRPRSLELMMRRYERASTLPRSNHSVDNWDNFL
jgi:hypothetical protein